MLKDWIKPSQATPLEDFAPAAPTYFGKPNPQPKPAMPRTAAAPSRDTLNRDDTGRIEIAIDDEDLRDLEELAKRIPKKGSPEDSDDD